MATVFDLQAKLGLDSTSFMSGLSAAKVAALGGIAAIGAAATAFVASSVNVGMEFDKSMSQVAATMGTTVDQIEDLRNFALEMGSTTMFTASEAADALNYMALAGYKADQSMEMLPTVLNLAAAGNMDLAKASDMVTDSQTAFGLKAERTTKMVDEMAKAASTGNTSVEQLGDAFLVVGGLARELNGGMVELSDGTTTEVDGLQELEIALTAMANAGIKGGEAGTHMRNMLLKLSDPTKDGVAQLEALGVTVFDTEGNMRSLKDIFGDLNNSMSNLTQQQKLQAISDLFNTRDTASAEALLAAIGEDWDKIGAAILDSAGAAEQMAETQLDNLAGDVTKFKSALEGAKIQLSDKLTPSLRSFVQWGTEKVALLPEVFDKIQAAFGRIYEAISPVIEKIASMVNGEEMMKDATQFLSEAFDGFIVVLEYVAIGIVKIIEFIEAAIQWVKDFIAAVQEIWAEIKQTFEEGREKTREIIDNIVEFFTNLWETIKSVIDWIVEAFTTGWAVIQYVWSVVVDFFVGIWEGIKNVFVGVGLWFYEKFKTAWNNIKFVWDVVVDFFLDIWDGIKNVFIGVAQWFQEKFKTAWEKIKDVWSVVVKFFLDIWDGIKNVFIGAKKWFGDKFTAAWTAITDVWNGVVQFFTDIWEDIKGVFEEVKKWFEEKFGEAWEAIKTPFAAVEEFFGGIWEKITDAFDVSDADSWGEDMMNNFRSGVERARSWVVDSVSSVAASIKSFLGFSEPDVGPLSNFHTFAPDMMKLFAQGIRDNEYLITDQIAKSFDFGDTIGGEYEISGGVAKAQDSGVVINVYATERQDEYEIAQEVQRVFVQWENQRKAAYA